MTSAIAQLLGGGGLFVGFAALLVYVATRRRDRATEAKERFDQADELNRYIDARVETVTGPMLEKIEALETLVGSMVDRDTKVKNILRGFFQRLRFWNTHGREGEMPMPSDADMAVLELEVTIPPMTHPGATVTP